MVRYWLTIVQGPNKGTEFDLEAEEIVVGRHPDCGININDPEVSRKHFKLSKKVDEYWIEDMGSMNATIVNSRAIQSAYRLRNNSKIKLGANVTLVFKKEAPQPVTRKSQPTKVEEVKEKRISVKVDRPPVVTQELVPEQKRKVNWWAWGCFVFLLILVLAAAFALKYIDDNFLWCELFEWLPGCY